MEENMRRTLDQLLDEFNNSQNVYSIYKYFNHQAQAWRWTAEERTDESPRFHDFKRTRDIDRFIRNVNKHEEVKHGQEITPS